jgi:hypothetical protein
MKIHKANGRTLYAWCINPVDFGWRLLRTVDAVGAEMASHDTTDALEFWTRWEQAKAAARRVGWEGDYAEDPVVLPVPEENQFDYGFVIKHSNNGDTFVLSPIYLPWLAAMDLDC